MSKKNESYKLEAEAEKLVREIRLFIKRAGTFIFTIPKKKMDKYIYIMDILAWTALTISMVLRIFGR